MDKAHWLADRCEFYYILNEDSHPPRCLVRDLDATIIEASSITWQGGGIYNDGVTSGACIDTGYTHPFATPFTFAVVQRIDSISTSYTPANGRFAGGVRLYGGRYSSTQYILGLRDSYSLGGTSDIVAGDIVLWIIAWNGTTGYLYKNLVEVRNLTPSVAGPTSESLYIANFASDRIQLTKTYWAGFWSYMFDANQMAQLLYNPYQHIIPYKPFTKLPYTGILYTRGDYAVLPTNDDDLENSFSIEEVKNVRLDDNIYTLQTADGEYAIFQFKNRHSNNTDPIAVTWKGKSSLAPSSNAIKLQIRDRVTGGGQWVDMDTNNTASVDEEFTLEGTITTSLSNYYDANNWVSFRVYQEI